MGVVSQHRERESSKIFGPNFKDLGMNRLRSGKYLLGHFKSYKG